MPPISPTLSVMMIAKDEAAVIGTAIDSVKPIATEILVGDTGSSDDTREVAQAHGATVFNVPWADDFSAARNFVLDRATGDWCMGMDADEQLLPESIPAVHDALRNPAALGYFITLRNLDDVTRPDVFTEMVSMRILRHLPGVHFEGRIHEHLVPPMPVLMQQTGQKLLNAPIYLQHTGFIRTLKETKLRRSAKLLALELQERPNQLYYMIEHGRTLIQLGDMSGLSVLEAASKMVWAQKDAPRPPIPSIALLLEFILLGAGQNLKAGPITEDEAMYLADKWFPQSAPLLWMRANRLFARNQFDKAASALEQLLEIGRTGNYDRSINFDPRILRADAMLNLGACYARLGNIELAKQCFQSILTDPRAGEAAQKNLAILNARK